MQIWILSLFLKQITGQEDTKRLKSAQVGDLHIESDLHNLRIKAILKGSAGRTQMLINEVLLKR